MPDNVGYTEGSGTKIASREVSYSGETAQSQAVGLVTFSGNDDAKVATDVSLNNPIPSIADKTDNLLVLLSRVVKLLESNAVVDSSQRQRVVIDAGTIATVTNVGVCSLVSTVSNVVQNAGMDREQYINIAKQTYAQSIRSRLEFV